MYKRKLWGTAALGACATIGGVLLTRRLARRSGATTSEVYGALPGDELVPEPQIETTRAITIRAPVAGVWPWVAQVGYHRGGWYTNAWLDKLIWRIDNPSADRILPEYQRLAVGDIVPDGPPGTARFIVAEVEPGHLLALHDPDGTHIPNTSFSWVFVLREINAGMTRLLLRTRATHSARWWTTPLTYIALGPADFLMAHVMLLRGIKQRAERAATDLRSPESQRPAAEAEWIPLSPHVTTG
jgi:hypothetical protein